MRITRSSAGALLGLLAVTAVFAWAVRRGWSRSKLPRRRAMTQALVPVQPADVPLGPPGRNLDRRLDEALRETYPASDPIAVHIE
jgi:hypothetical protein